MYCSSALVAATLVLQASAFLIPPKISELAEGAKGSLETLWTSNTQTYELECVGCPFAGFDEHDIQWEEGVENRIQLEFRIDNQQLRVNDHLVFPPGFNPNHEVAFVARQIRASDLKLSVPIPLGFVVEYLQDDYIKEEPGKRLIPLQFTILDLKGVPVKVETIKIDLVESGVPPHHHWAGADHELTIAKLSNIPFAETPGAVECATSSKWSLCRIKAIIAARLQDMVDAAKARAQTAKTWVKGAGCPGKKDKGHKKGGHHKGGHHHRGHRFLHRIGKFLHTAIRFFVVPALLGVIGGLMASAVGMLVGQAIVYMWIHFHRRGQRGPVRLVEVVVLEDEKDALIATETGELPPDYKDVEVLPAGDEKN